MKHPTMFVILILSLSAVTANGQTELPHTFEAGQPARAAEVNANFDDLEAAINENADDLNSLDADVTAQSSDIQVNSADIAENTADILTIQNSVSENSASIASSSSMISANNSAIVANAAAISALETSSGVMVYSAGSKIGRFLAERANTEASMIILSNEGYIFRTNPNLSTPHSHLGTDHPVYFADMNCSGDAYISLVGSMWEITAGAVIRADAGSPSLAYYTQRGSVPLQNVAYQSFANGSTCNANSPGITDLIPVLPNDPAVTGVTNTPPSSPLTLGMP